jgi:V-type H+-transporting ATPase subunit a
VEQRALTHLLSPLTQLLGGGGGGGGGGRGGGGGGGGGRARGAVQFKDLNPDLTPFQRRYVSNIKRCEELERKLKYFSVEIEKVGLPLQSCGSLDRFLSYANEANARGAPEQSGLQLLEKMERDLEKHESFLKELNSLNETLVASRNTKMELQQVMNKTQEMMGDVMLPLQQTAVGVGVGGGEVDAENDLFDTGGFGMSNLGPDEEDRRGLLAAGTAGDARQMDMRFTATTGVIQAAEKARFERMLFRATRGNCFFQFMDIDTPLTDPATGELVEKMAFVIFYKSATIASKIKRICDAFGASVYNLPDLNDKAAYQRLKEANGLEIRESQLVLNKNREQRVGLCTHLAQFVVQWTWEVLREKAIYHTLNMFKADVTGMLRAEGWIVAMHENPVRAALSKAHLSLMQDVAKSQWPKAPTHFETNKFTSPFQDFVDTYGVPRYKEANPALFTAVTFPFLFGVMYGDIGHGSILFLGGLALVLSERSMENAKMDEMSAGVFGARYMILLMGAFAVYAGLIYNDFFALGLNLFGSSFKWALGLETESGTVAERTGSCTYGDSSCVYPFGVDPAWHISSNELLFFNSMKMKMSVILGIAQMTVGICLKGLNAYYFKEQLDFLFEFLPMIVFDMCFFGYMVLLIFMKWQIDWDARMYMATCNEDNAHWPACSEEGADYSTADLCPLDYGGTGDGCQPPNLITTLMNMALMPGSVGDPMYAGQATVQVLLLLLAGISVPILLVAKPLMLKSRMGDHGAHGDRDRINSEVRTFITVDKQTKKITKALENHTNACLYYSSSLFPPPFFSPLSFSLSP